MTTKFVVDVSTFNAVSNYDAMANAVDGVIMRVGYRGYGASGTLCKDGRFETHYSNFSRYSNVKLGVYFLSQAITTSEAIAEVNYIHNILNGRKIDFPIYIDSEYSNGNHDGRADGLSKASRTEITIAFCERCKELGYKTGVYASDYWFYNNLDWRTLYDKGYSLWVAKYSSYAPSYCTNYDAWQYTSTASVGEFSPIDASRFYNDVAGWEGGTTVTDINTISGWGLNSNNFIYNGSIQKPTVIYPSSVDKNHISVTIENSINVGTYNVTIKGSDIYSGTIIYNYSISAQDIPTGYIPQTKYGYTGNPIKPTVTITNLKEDIDFTITYEDNPVNIGTHSLIVIGKGNYKSSYKISYEIMINDISKYEIKIDKYEYDYTGLAITPKVIIVGLTEDTDFTTSYINNINIGTATITIKGKGTFIDSPDATIKFSIVKGNILDYNFKLEKNEYLYSGLLIYPTVVVDTLIKDKDYSLEYYDNINPGIGKVIITGKNNYQGTVTLNFNIYSIQIKDYNPTLSFTSIVFDNFNHIPNVIINRLKEGIDYKITAPEIAINVKKYTITIEGIGDYIGTVTLQFEITSRDISNIIPYTEKSIYYYTGYEIKPQILFNTDLIEGYDYKLTYLDNIKIGVGKVKIDFIGNYKGTKTVNFTISYSKIGSCIGKVGVPTIRSKYRVNNENYILHLYATQELYEKKVELVENVDYIIIDTLNNYIVDDNFYLYSVQVKGIGGFEDSFIFRFRLIKEEPDTPIDLNDDGVYNFGDIDEHDESAEGDYDCGDLDYIPPEPEPPEPEDSLEDIDDNEIDSLNLEEDEEINYDFDKLSTLFLDLYDEDDGKNIDEMGNGKHQDPVIAIIDTDDGLYNFGDIDELDETAEGDYDMGDLDEGFSPDNVADGNYDFNILAQDGKEGFMPGDEYELNNTNIYPSYCTDISSGKKTGTYYIYDKRIVDGKIRITKDQTAIDDPVRSTGWCKVVDLVNLGNIYVGDRVILNGKLYKYINGTGGFTIYENQYFYVCEITDERYQYCYGLTNAPNGARLGFADKDSLTKADNLD